MTDTTGTASWPSGERRASGVTRILLGFVIGALFALLPMYYFYMGREAALKTGGAPGALEQRLAFEPALATGDSKPFASRLTYELSRPPEERPVPAPKAPAPPPRVTTAAAPVTTAAAPMTAPEPQVSERVANARPINVTPPAPRDRTREIEKESHKREYREPPREPAKPAAAPAARVVEGRDVDVKKLPDMPTRPIVAGGPGNMRAEIEAERRMAGDPTKAPDGAKSGAAPKALVALAPASAPAVSAEAPPAAGSAANTAPTATTGDAVEARLEATRAWLAGATSTTHTIQLMGTGSSEQLRAQLKALGKALDPAKVYLFRTKAQGKPSITVVYGAFPDRQSAVRALEKLPASVTANKPVLRTVNGIRTELKQNNTEG